MSLSKYLEQGRRERVAHKNKLETRHGLVGHCKADALYALAWDYGHSAGYHEIETHYDDLSQLLIKEQV
jgi:hypothetical protein